MPWKRSEGWRKLVISEYYAKNWPVDLKERMGVLAQNKLSKKLATRFAIYCTIGMKVFCTIHGNITTVSNNTSHASR